MKQRLTYLLKDVSNFDLDKLKVTQDSFSVQSLDAAKEQHVTFGLDELPQEIRRVLKQCHQLHLRWSSPHAYGATPPFLSRLSPGLHVFFTPQRNSSADFPCPLLKKLFSSHLKCESPSESFIPQPILSERFSTTASASYYHVLPSLGYFITYVQQKLCPDAPCQQDAETLLVADYVDIDFDTVSHAVVLRAFWASAPPPTGWTESTRLRKSIGSLEVGVLNNETPAEPEELKLGGFLTVVGTDSEPKQTLFGFPARYHPLPSKTTPKTYSISFNQPTGLHPTLRITLPTPPQQPSPHCALHTYLTLPSYLFIDKYQFSDPLFLSSHHLRRLHSITGATDLEAPDWAIRQWGSAALFELEHASSPPPRQPKRDHEITIPLHLRYLAPAANSAGITNVSVPWPVVFWACAAPAAPNASTGPFDRPHVGYDGLFGPETVFYHLAPAPVRVGGGGEAAVMVETIGVPVLDLDRAAWVEVGTVVAIAVGVLWLVWMLVRPLPKEAGLEKGGEKKAQ